MSGQLKRIFAAAPFTERGRPIHLSLDPKGEKLVYASGRGIYVRSVSDPTDAYQYLGHLVPTTVARFSPSGYYVASADTSGTVRVWDTVGEEHILKNEIKALSGRVNDLAWDSESQRIIAVGEGKTQFGAAFTYDTGNSSGEISGHSKAINAVDIRPSGRPFRAVTASEDGTANFFHGVPFKFSHSLRDHTRFVHTARYSPNGETFLTAGADAKLFLYEGKTGEKIKELSVSGAGEIHQGSIMGASWSSDSKRILTASADRTVKIWDVETAKVSSTFSMGTTTDAQQMGCVWSGVQDQAISLGLDGSLSYLDSRDPTKPSRVVHGHQVAITAASLNTKEPATFFTGSYDGRVLSWDGEAGQAQPIQGKGHITQVTGVQSAQGSDRMYSVGLDNHLCEVDVSKGSFGENHLNLEATPLGMVVPRKEKSLIFTTGPQGVEMIKVDEKGARAGEGKLVALPNGASGLSIDVDGEGKEVVVGGEDSKIHLLRVIEDGKGLELIKSLEGPTSAITAISLSPEGEFLVVGTSTGKIYLYTRDPQGSWTIKTSRWAFHTAKILCFSWTRDGKYVISGSLDTQMYVWSVDRPAKKVKIPAAHQDGVTAVGVVEGSDSKEIFSTGRDACVKRWAIDAWP
ncbi:WD repeat-containing protein-like protein 1 [Piptocephalis cylindrospora]|uniref:WD repeat-containing protein-like protein 1 n=1 Tax=Piptocephalis cylindrospora TaxID=1907219 RepID=A0A4P9Y5S8_9FUNG|nr:WD repeat-containing protein-like protein 1 [Piptocephalis cylindrospora]|eukprot:RKP14313.1 WD repeat-containing protein-like protein 1 [Piptocephalis cylindrospora]